MSADARPSVLLVDDDPLVLDALAPHFRRQYEVRLARGAQEGLRILEESGATVVVADMRMPVMDGATFLGLVSERWPHTSRIMLTGDPSLDAAVAAVNDGRILRYLAKPCPPEELRAAVAEGVRTAQRLEAEKRLLEETLLGSVRALVDVLAIAHPVAFGRAGRIKRQAVALASRVGHGGDWELEAAALFSQLGYLALPQQLVQRVYDGDALDEQERLLLSGVPAVAQRLLRNVPRLDGVLGILAATEWTASCLGQLGPRRSRAAAILAVVLDHDRLVAQGHSPEESAALLRLQGGRYDEQVVASLAALAAQNAGGRRVRTIPLREVQPGMSILDELRSETGMPLAPAGFEVSPGFLERMTSFSQRLLAEGVRVSIPG